MSGKRDKQRSIAPDDYAAALHFEAKSNRAPAVSMVGQRLLAREMLNLARRYGIRVQTDHRLAKSLAVLEPDQEIPPELYDEVAQLLVDLRLAAR